MILLADKLHFQWETYKALLCFAMKPYRFASADSREALNTGVLSPGLVLPALPFFLFTTMCWERVGWLLLIAS